MNEKLQAILMLAFGLFIVIGNKLFYRTSTGFQQTLFGIKPPPELMSRILVVLFGIFWCVIAIWGLLQ